MEPVEPALTPALAGTVVSAYLHTRKIQLLLPWLVFLYFPLFSRIASFLMDYLQSLAVKLAICQLSKDRCCWELGQHKSVLNTSFESIYTNL